MPARARGAAVQRYAGVATAVFPNEPDGTVYNNAVLERDLGRVLDSNAPHFPGRFWQQTLVSNAHLSNPRRPEGTDGGWGERRDQQAVVPPRVDPREGARRVAAKAIGHEPFAA
jgi:hypothetical protein